MALKIPRELRTSTDNLRIFSVVVSCPHKNIYELRCKHGTLNRKFPTKNLERVLDTVAEGITIPPASELITLAQAAERKSTSERVRISYQCKGDCTSKRCRCYKKGLQCSVHCHTDDHHCQNLSNLSERTQVGLKDNRTRKRQRGDTIGDAIVVERSR